MVIGVLSLILMCVVGMLADVVPISTPPPETPQPVPEDPGL